MTAETYLFILFMSILILLVYGIITNKTTEEERDEMLNDEDMFP